MPYAVLRHRLVSKRLSIASALTYEPDGSDAHLVFELRLGAYNGETLIEFLAFLHEIERRLARTGPTRPEQLQAGLARIEAIATRAADQTDELLHVTRLQMDRPLDLDG